MSSDETQPSHPGPALISQSWALRRHSETDSSGVSPCTSPKRPAPHGRLSSFQRLRQALPVRSKSDYDKMPSRFTINPVAARLPTIQTTRHPSVPSSGHRSPDAPLAQSVQRSRPRPQSESTARSSQPSSQSVFDKIRPFVPRFVSDGGFNISSNTTSRPARPGHKSKRSASGAVWVELRHSSLSSGKEERPDNHPFGSFQKRSRLTSKRKAHSYTNGVLPPPKPLIPLIPPPLEANSEPPQRHAVRMEQSFTRLKEDTSESDHTSRKTSRTRELFTATVRTAKNISGSVVQTIVPTKEALEDEATISKSRGVSKRDDTAEALRRVSSLLHLMGSGIPHALLPGQRPFVGSLENQTVTGDVAALNAKAHSSEKTRQVPLELHLSKRDSRDFTYHTDSSSIREAGKTLTPMNTPDPTETYKVKRSPSAETEEFLKIDISIRGGTSYLPSEAKRIHTPPLPVSAEGGQRRGFFFDYNAPCDEHGNKGVHEEVMKTFPRELEVPTRRQAPKNPDTVKGPKRKTTGLSTIGRACETRPRNRGKKCADTAWYERELAEVDNLGSAEKGPSENHFDRGSAMEHARKAKATARETFRRPEKKVDYNIPEHLPSSPLCPRHPRYWRLEQGAGRDEVCWMHGRNGNVSG